MKIEENEDTVDSLIDSNTKWWNIRKIRALFNPTITANIVKIIICPRDHEDKWTWTPEKNHKFSIKSVYRLFREKQNNPGESLDANRQQALFHTLWKLKVSNKFKVFALESL